MQAALQVNWRNKASYAYAAKLTGLGWAWEFLRRNPRFREECARSAARPAAGGKTPRPIFPPSKWGVLRTDSLDQTAAEANVFWDPAVCLSVLQLIAPAAPLGAPHNVLVCEGERRLQLAIWHCPCIEEDALLTSALVAPDGLRQRQRSLAGLNAYIFTGHLPVHLFPQLAGGARLVHVAQALDGALSSASHREIAAAVYGERRVLTSWNDPGEHLRDTVRRSIVRGKSLMNGGYRRFLR